MNVPLRGTDLARLVDALHFAADKHRDQRRKDAGASPYINHPIELTQVLVDEGGVDDIETLMAAVLHDTVEDTQTTRDELAARFGEVVASVVMECTDDKSLEKPLRKRAQVEHAPHLSQRAKLVKLADKICNLRDMLDRPPDRWALQRRQEYFEWSREVVDALGPVNARLRARFDEIYARKPQGG